MNFQINQLFDFTEILQKKLIGEPTFLDTKGAFEYPCVDIKVVCVLKAIRAAQGLRSLEMLCLNGLFIDMGAIFRCNFDSIAEIYFLLEKYPAQSPNVKKFIKSFAEKTRDYHLQSESETVQTKKIHAAMQRAIKDQKQCSTTLKAINRIYRTFSGYVHADYAHIMQIYEGNTQRFKIEGINSENQICQHYLLVIEQVKSYLYALHYISSKFDLIELRDEINSHDLLNT